jgi:hypothetical protein
MRTFILSTRTISWMLALTSFLLITACGGDDEPVLGADPLQAAPSVSATAPLASNPVATGVAVNTRITATFNKPMSPGSLNTNTFTLQCPAGTNTVSSVDYDALSRVATLTPAAYLPAGARCTATMTTGAQDTNGIALPVNFIWAFDTGSSSDITAPVVSQQLPAQSAITATNTQLSLTFSEEMPFGPSFVTSIVPLAEPASSSVHFWVPVAKDPLVSISFGLTEAREVGLGACARHRQGTAAINVAKGRIRVDSLYGTGLAPK